MYVGILVHKKIVGLSLLWEIKIRGQNCLYEQVVLKLLLQEEEQAGNIDLIMEKYIEGLDLLLLFF